MSADPEQCVSQGRTHGDRHASPRKRRKKKKKGKEMEKKTLHTLTIVTNVLLQPTESFHGYVLPTYMDEVWKLVSVIKKI